MLQISLISLMMKTSHPPAGGEVFYYWPLPELWEGLILLECVLQCFIHWFNDIADTGLLLTFWGEITQCIQTEDFLRGLQDSRLNQI